MDIRRNADRLTLIYTATLSRYRFGSAVHATGTCVHAIAPEHAAAKRGHHPFFFGPRKRGVRPHPPNPPWLRACFVCACASCAVIELFKTFENSKRPKLAVWKRKEYHAASLRNIAATLMSDSHDIAIVLEA